MTKKRHQGERADNVVLYLNGTKEGRTDIVRGRADNVLSYLNGTKERADDVY